MTSSFRWDSIFGEPFKGDTCTFSGGLQDPTLAPHDANAFPGERTLAAGACGMSGGRVLVPRLSHVLASPSDQRAQLGLLDAFASLVFLSLSQVLL